MGCNFVHFSIISIFNTTFNSLLVGHKTMRFQFFFYFFVMDKSGFDYKRWTTPVMIERVMVMSGYERKLDSIIVFFYLKII